MTLNRLVGKEPILVDQTVPNVVEQLDTVRVTAGSYVWRPATNLRIRVKEICIDLATAAGGAGRYPIIQHARKFPSTGGQPTAGWYIMTQATPAAGSGHYTWAVGLNNTTIAVGGVIPFACNDIPPEMYLNRDDYLEFILENYAAGDVWQIKIIYDIIGE